LFVDGMESLTRRDFSNAISQLHDSMVMYPSAETAFFQGKAAMAASAWDTAIGALDWIIKNRVQVFTDSIGSLVALATNDLSICYEHKGNETEANTHRTEAEALWAASDPEVRGQLAHR
jgi:hypothetical protein